MFSKCPILYLIVLYITENTHIQEVPIDGMGDTLFKEMAVCNGSYLFLRGAHDGSYPMMRGTQ